MKNVWIIGAGLIAQEYAKVLKNLGYDYIAIGRGVEKAKSFQEATGHECIAGGLQSFLDTKPFVPEYVIVATNLSSLAENCIALMKLGVKRILCEKPGFLYPSELTCVFETAKETKSSVFYAYNRRFLASVLKAGEIISEDGGVKSFNFEFTEWGHVIEKANKPEGDLDNWFYANSSHVVDLAFFLGGKPAQMMSYSLGETSWHKPAIFAGAGISTKGALFNYAANWAAPGRWGVEILTSLHRLYLRPMEQLHIQYVGSVAINPVEIDDYLDKEFKPGFYLETKAFIEGDYSRLCTLEEQIDCLKNYNMICNR